MIKLTSIKPLLLLGLVGVMLIAAIGPISGHQMADQANNTGKENMMGNCPCGNYMMQSHMMDEHAGNETMKEDDHANGEHMMMHCMMGEHSENGTIMHCMMNEHSGNATNETMMDCPCMMGPEGNYNMDQTRSACASYWLNKAIKLHELHMEDPEEADNESSQLELMDQMQNAYVCLTGQNITENMTDNMTKWMMNETNHDSAEHNKGCPCSSMANIECASFWLKKAIDLHELHLTDPKEAANESSQMEMMNQMMRAYACLNGNNMNMPMDQNLSATQARLDCATFWLKQAIEIHDLHLSDPKEAANESSQIEMMNQMMKAYACLTGENMTHNMTRDGMTNITAAHVSGTH